MRSLFALALGAVLLVSCSQPPPDTTKVRQEIEAIGDKAEKEMMAGKIDTTMDQYTEDAVSLPNNGPMLKGKVAFKENSRQMLSLGLKFSNVDFTTVDVLVGTPYIIEIGTYVMTIQMAGMPELTDKGKYLTVYERMSDGALKIKAETWNTDTEIPMGKPPAESTSK